MTVVLVAAVAAATAVSVKISSMVTILPAILAVNKAEFEAKLKKVFGLVDAIQVDIIDEAWGFEPTIRPKDIADVNTIIKFDFQLMVEEPINWLDECKTGQARAVFGHVEKMGDPAAFLAKAQIMGFQACLALDIDTPVEKIADYIWDLDGLLLMSVEAGRGGQSFEAQVLPKIKAVRQLRHDLPLVIDGGLDVGQIKQCVEAEWAEEIGEGELRRNFLDIQFAVGNHLFDAPDIKQKLTELQHLGEG